MVWCRSSTKICVPDWMSLRYWTNQRRYTDETLLSYATKWISFELKDLKALTSSEKLSFLLVRFFQFLPSVIVFYLIYVTTKVLCHKCKTLTHKKSRVHKWEKIWSPFGFLRITALKGPSASLRTIQWYSFYFRFLPLPRAGRWLWGSWTVLSAWYVFPQSCDINKKIIAMYDRWGTKVSSLSSISGNNPWCDRVQ